MIIKTVWAAVWAVGCSIIVSSQAAAMSVEEAYQAVPHQRTVFDARSADINAGDAIFLKELFGQIDRAIIAKVQTLQWFQSSGDRGEPFQRYTAQINAVLGHLKGMAVPVRLKHVHGLVVEAIQDHQSYFAESQAAKEHGELFQPRYISHPRIHSSSQKLVEAYHELMTLYPQATPRNKQAFFDYLCALDFV